MSSAECVYADVSASVSLAMSRNSQELGKLSYDFQWLPPNDTSSVDLDLDNPQTAMFLELLYFTCV